MFNKNSKYSAIRNILIATVLFVLYIVFVAYPFLAANQPPNESTSKWAYDYAPVHYAMIYFPAYALYVYSILKNILNIKYLRWLIYPLVFIMLFIATHMVFFVFSMVILWFGLITIPVGFISLIAIEGLAIGLDIKGHKQNAETNTDNCANIQKYLDIICKFIIPISLLCFIVFFHFVITVLNPKMKLQAEHERSLQCEKNKQVIQTAINNVNIDINNATFKEISDKFQKEFSKKNIYEPLLDIKYDKVEARTGGDFSEFQFSSKYRDGVMVEAFYEFHRKNKCSGSNENCIWLNNACKIIIDEKGKIIN